MNKESDNFEIIKPDSLIKNPGVSVVMSVYNGEKYLKESMESILSQTYNNFEFIIINDGSTDSTPGILKEYLKKDNRIVIINQENIGLTKSLNRGIGLSRGKLIARQDADDISYPERLAKQVRWFSDSEDRVLCGTNATIIGEDGKVLYVKQALHNEKNILNYLLINNPFFHTSVMFSRKAWKDISGYREFFKYAQDYDFYCRLSEKGEIGILNEPLAAFRKNKGGISKCKTVEQHRYGAVAGTLFYAGKKYPLEEFNLDFSNFHIYPDIDKKLRRRYNALFNYYMICIKEKPLCPRFKLFKYAFLLRHRIATIPLILYFILGHKLYSFSLSLIKSHYRIKLKEQPSLTAEDTKL